MQKSELGVTSALDAEGLADERQYSLWRDAFARLLANRLAVVGMILVLLLFFV